MENNFFRAAVVALLLAISACAKDGVAADQAKGATADAAAAIPVEVAKPIRGEMLAMYSGTATLEAEADAEIIAKVGGEVRRILVEEGDRVRAGQVLAVLDDRQLRLQAAQTRAALAKSERDFNRQVELHEKGLVSAGAFEGLKYDLDNQRAADDIAPPESLLQRHPRAIRRRRLRASREVRPGNRRSAPACSASPTPLRSRPRCTCRSASSRGSRSARRHPSASMHSPGRAFPAIVKLVAPTVDAATATFKVTLEVNDPKGDLKPGMFSRVGIVFERRAEALTIPRIALLDTDGASNVFVVNGGKAEQRTIKTGLSNAGKVEVIEGLTGSEQVVVVGQNGLKDGNPVRVVSLEQTAKAGS